MSLLTKEDLRLLTGEHAGPCVSIYMPTHRAGREVQQNPTRLKKMLRSAEEELRALDLSPRQIDEILDPIRAFLPDTSFWQHQGQGLAVFASSEEAGLYRLPLDLDELLVVGDRFHIKPLIPLFGEDSQFYVLAISQEEVRLLQGTRYRVREVQPDELPRSLSEALRYNDPERRLQFHTTTITPGGADGRPAQHHGHGVGNEDKDRILRYFHHIDDGIEDALGGETAPLVLVGVDYLLPLYREANSYPHLVDEGVEGNPDELSLRELHQQAWNVVQPLMRAAREEDAARYQMLAGQGSDLAASDLGVVVSAAQYGRVETLFVTPEEQCWGAFTPDTGTVETHEERQAGDEDLLDVAAVQTMLNKGTVYVVDREDVPGDGPLAAIFRYELE